MTEIEAFSKIKIKLEEKKKKTSDMIDIRKINAIENLIKNRFCFLEINYKTAIEIFKFLEFNYDDTISIYSCLSNIENLTENYFFK